MVNKPRVSIVVATYNNQNTIENTIQSILRIDYPQELVELIIVDDGSTDETKKIIEKYLKNGRVKYFWQENKGPATARNNGIRHSTGDIVIFTDSDCEVPEDWAMKLVSNFNGSLGAVGGSLKPVSVRTKWEAFEQFRREELYGSEKRIIDALPSCNLAIKKEVLEKTGGFDESFRYPSSEDYDLCYKIRSIGYKILYDPAIYVYHNHAQNWKGVLKRAYLHGKEGVKLKQKQKQSILWDIVFIGRIVILPLIVVQKYPHKLYWQGIVYELMAIMGGIRGMVLYR